MSRRTYALWAAEILIMGAIAIFGTEAGEEFVRDIHEELTAPSQAQREASRARYEQWVSRQRDAEQEVKNKQLIAEQKLEQKLEQARQAIAERQNELDRIASSICRTIDEHTDFSAFLKKDEPSSPYRIYATLPTADTVSPVKIEILGNNRHRSVFYNRTYTRDRDFWDRDFFCGIEVLLLDNNSVEVKAVIETAFEWHPDKPWSAEESTNNIKNYAEEKGLDVEFGYVDLTRLGSSRDLDAYAKSFYSYSESFATVPTPDEIERFIKTIKSKQSELDQLTKAEKQRQLKKIQREKDDQIVEQIRSMIDATEEYSSNKRSLDPYDDYSLGSIFDGDRMEGDIVRRKIEVKIQDQSDGAYFASGPRKEQFGVEYVYCDLIFMRKNENISVVFRIANKPRATVRRKVFDSELIALPDSPDSEWVISNLQREIKSAADEFAGDQ